MGIVFSEGRHTGVTSYLPRTAPRVNARGTASNPLCVHVCCFTDYSCIIYDPIGNDHFLVLLVF